MARTCIWVPCSISASCFSVVLLDLQLSIVFVCEAVAHADFVLFLCFGVTDPEALERRGVFGFVCRLALPMSFTLVTRAGSICSSSSWVPCSTCTICKLRMLVVRLRLQLSFSNCVRLRNCSPRADHDFFVPFFLACPCFVCGARLGTLPGILASSGSSVSPMSFTLVYLVTLATEQ